MSKGQRYPYGYQLSFFERLRLRLKKINYRLSLGIWISFFVLAGIFILTKDLISESQLAYWQKIWSGVFFFLFGLQGLVWAITGEMKKSTNLTTQGKWITIIGLVLWIYCWLSWFVLF